MTLGKILLEPGTLWTNIQKQTKHALECGALLSIPTEFEFVEQDGVNFLVRILANIDRKKEAKKKQVSPSGQEFNPFLPYEEDLFVADISDTHVCILNKFNVVDYHLLIITRVFEKQESLLTLADFTALRECLAEVDGLAFYNSSKIAGASQPHKHLQIVPLPITPSGVEIPIAPLLAKAEFTNMDTITTIPQFPFVHAFTKLNLLMNPESILDYYHRLLNAVGLKSIGDYNFLATREWMLIVLRSQEEFASIGVNSLGFAGTLLVRNQEQMQLLKEISPMHLLKQVAVPK